MDNFSLIGLIVCILAIVTAQILEGGHINSLLNAPAFLVVFGGTIGAVLIETPNYVFSRSVKLMPWVFFPPKNNYLETLEQMVKLCFVARREGFIALENALSDNLHPFATKGLQMLVDGSDPKTICQALEVEMCAAQERDLQAAKVFESMGGYAPTLGILGAVLGLIHVMGNLANPDMLGPGIAVAFVATVYGVAFANLCFIPVGKKIENLVQADLIHKELILEGVLSIARGENPRMLEIKLKGFFE